MTDERAMGPGVRDPETIVAAAERACERAAALLNDANVAPEALAEHVPARRTFLWTRQATMRPLGEVWRIGALLLGRDARLYALGRATRAAERGRPGYQSVSREQRREIAAAALRGGYPIGTPVNFDATPVSVAALVKSGTPGQDTAGAPAESDAQLPIGYANGELRVRWRAGASLAEAPSLEAFLTERVGLLIAPPFAGD